MPFPGFSARERVKRNRFLAGKRGQPSSACTLQELHWSERTSFVSPSASLYLTLRSVLTLSRRTARVKDVKPQRSSLAGLRGRMLWRLESAGRQTGELGLAPVADGRGSLPTVAEAAGMWRCRSESSSRWLLLTLPTSQTRLENEGQTNFPLHHSCRHIRGVHLH